MAKAQAAKHDTNQKRKSIQELAETIERSGERLVDDLSSSLLAWAEVGSDVVLGVVRVAAQAAEAGSERLNVRLGDVDQRSRSFDPTGLLSSYRETLTEVVRLQARTASQVVELAQESLERILDATKPQEAERAAAAS